MNSEMLVKDADKLWALLYRTTYAIKRVKEEELRALGITWIQFSVLKVIIKSEKPLRPTDIAHALFRKTHSISALLQRMDAQGLVIREKDKKIKTTLNIFATDKGKEIYNKCCEVNVIEELFDVLSATTKKTLYQGLDQLYRKALDQLKMSFFSSFLNLEYE